MLQCWRPTDGSRTAISRPWITGPKGDLLPGDPGTDPVLPDRNRPFHEVTVRCHESQDLVQAFPYFFMPANANVPTVNAGRDGFAINYGVAGVGPGDSRQPTRRRPVACLRRMQVRGVLPQLLGGGQSGSRRGCSGERVAVGSGCALRADSPAGPGRSGLRAE